MTSLASRPASVPPEVEREVGLGGAGVLVALRLAEDLAATTCPSYRGNPPPCVATPADLAYLNLGLARYQAAGLAPDDILTALQQVVESASPFRVPGIPGSPRGRTRAWLNAELRALGIEPDNPRP